MEKQLVNAFDQVTMPDSCVKKIENSLNPAPQTVGRYTARPMAVSRHDWLAPAAALMALVFMVGLMGGMNTEPEQLAEAPVETQAGTVREGEITEDQNWEFEDGLTYKEGRVTYTYSPSADGETMDSSSFWDTEAYHTPFTDYIDGRVYFIANGENLDITDQFSTEEPFTYIYTDSKLITHYIAIGDTPEHTGYFEMTQKSWDTSIEGQIGGVGASYWYRGEDDSWKCPWLLKAREVFVPYGIYFIV